jgi:hypothetical protein
MTATLNSTLTTAAASQASPAPADVKSPVEKPVAADKPARNGKGKGTVDTSTTLAGHRHTLYSGVEKSITASGREVEKAIVVCRISDGIKANGAALLKELRASKLKYKPSYPASTSKGKDGKAIATKELHVMTGAQVADLLEEYGYNS